MTTMTITQLGATPEGMDPGLYEQARAAVAAAGEKAYPDGDGVVVLLWEADYDPNVFVLVHVPFGGKYLPAPS